MDKEITIRDYTARKQVVVVPEFEDVQEITCKVLSGDEVLFVRYGSGREATFDSSDCRMENFYDGEFTIYARGEKDIIASFSAREKSYDEVEGESTEWRY